VWSWVQVPPNLKGFVAQLVEHSPPALLRDITNKNMRTREEILDQKNRRNDSYEESTDSATSLCLEVLLDIRDLLSPSPKE
tara:strand:- start:1231 stop:1473 length:243 start_codon:yes stop_codon:yes gene_type:complete